MRRAFLSSESFSYPRGSAVFTPRGARRGRSRPPPCPHSALPGDCPGGRISFPAAPGRPHAIFDASVETVRIFALLGGVGTIQSGDREPHLRCCPLSAPNRRLAPVRWLRLGRPRRICRAQRAPRPLRDRVGDIARPAAFHIVEKTMRLLAFAYGEREEVYFAARFCEL